MEIAEIEVAGDGFLAEVVRDVARSVVEHRQTDGPGAQRLLITCADWPDFVLFRAQNLRALEEGRHATFFHLNAERAVCGPYVVPGETSCFECYLLRFRAGLADPGSFDEFLTAREREAIGFAPLQGGLDAVHSPLTFLVYRHLFGVVAGAHEVGRPGHVDEFDPWTCASERREVIRLSACPACGASARARRRSAIRDLM